MKLKRVKFKPAKSAYSRIFLIKNEARPDRRPSFQAFSSAAGIEQDVGDVEDIECPDPQKYGSFVSGGTIHGEMSRPTFSLTERMSADVASQLLKFGQERCTVDIQVNLGECGAPSDFDEFDKAIILEGASIIDVSTDELGTLESGGQAAINVSSSISARSWYEILPIRIYDANPLAITNELIDIIIADSIHCGDCESASDGCQRIYAISKAGGGAVGTAADIVYSLDGGLNWHAEDVDGMGADEPSAIARIGSYIVVFDSTNAKHFYTTKAELTGEFLDSATWQEEDIGYAASGQPNDAWSIGSYAFIVGQNGYIYACEDPTAGVDLLDAGQATFENLLAVHAINREVAVAVGENGVVVYTNDGEAWQETEASPTSDNLQAVYVRSKREWLVGSDGGSLYYTTDRGKSWSEKTFSGSGLGEIHDIAAASRSVLYVAHELSGSGRILRSYNGGYSFVSVPDAQGIMPANTRVNALAACAYDVNALAAAGLASGGVDGFVARTTVSGITKTTKTYWYVDSVNGNDSNEGISPDAPLQTLAALEAKPLADYHYIGLKRGSHFREYLDLRDYNGITLAAYGSGDAPIIDASNMLANASFSKTGGYTYVYQINVTPDWAGSGNDFLNAFENDEFLIRTASIAACDALAGSMYISSEGSGTVTLYVHAYDNSDVTANGKTYEYTHRQTTVWMINAENHVVRGLDLRRSLRTIGVLHMGPGCAAYDCTIRQGNKLGIVVKINGLVSGCTTYGGYYGGLSSTCFDIFDVAADGDFVNLANCVAIGSTNAAVVPYITGFAGHTDGVHRWTATIRNATVTNCAAGFNFTDYENIYLYDCSVTCGASANYRGISVGSNTVNAYVDGCTFTMAGGKALGDSTGTGTNFTITNSTVTFSATANTAMIHSTKPSDFVFNNVTFNDNVPDISAAIALDHASATLSAHYCTYNDPKWAYYLNASIAPGSGFVSDYNYFSEEDLRNNVAGTNHFNMTTYRAATGQDSHSTVG